MNSRDDGRPLPAALLVVAAAAIAAGCVTAGPVVPLRGSPSDYGRLAGEWTGTYESRATGRSGSIRFTLIAGEDHAHGDVLMTRVIPNEGTELPYDARYPRRQSRTEANDLTIRFVRVSDAGVEGLLDPYWEPTCECQVVTAFYGEQMEDRIAGMFVSKVGDSVATGRWEVTRTHESRR